MCLEHKDLEHFLTGFFLIYLSIVQMISPQTQFFRDSYTSSADLKNLWMYFISTIEESSAWCFIVVATIVIWPK